MSYPVNLRPLPKPPREPLANTIQESGEYAEIDSDTTEGLLLQPESRHSLQMRRSQCEYIDP